MDLCISLFPKLYVSFSWTFFPLKLHCVYTDTLSNDYANTNLTVWPSLYITKTEKGPTDLTVYTESVNQCSVPLRWVTSRWWLLENSLFGNPACKVLAEAHNRFLRHTTTTIAPLTCALNVDLVAGCLSPSMMPPVDYVLIDHLYGFREIFGRIGGHASQNSETSEYSFANNVYDSHSPREIPKETMFHQVVTWPLNRGR